MKCVFVNTGLDSYLSEKIRKSRIHDNAHEGLPKKEVGVKPLYQPPTKGNSFLAGFTVPGPQAEELRKAVEAEEKERDERIPSEEELLEALDALDAIAIGRR